MAYKSDVTALSPAHFFPFDGNATDTVAALGSTDTSMVWSNSAIANDATNAMNSNAVDDLLELDSSAYINEERNQILVAGWFKTNKIQQPPCRIYGDGSSSASVSIHLGFGNQVLFEVDSDPFTLQIYGDTPLVQDRIYHLAIRFESSTYGDIFKGYLDGVEQTDTVDNTPGDKLGQSRTKGSFGGKNSGLALGGVDLKIVSIVNGHYNHWAFWNGTNASNVSDSEIRTELFEKGAIPSVTISDQAGLDALASTVRGNAPLCIAITGTNLDLIADNVTFDPLSSIHIQWQGSGVLNWTNNNGSNATIVSNIGGGTVNVKNPRTVNFTNLQAGTEIRIYETGTTTEVSGIEEENTGSWSTVIPDGFYDIRVVSVNYRNIEYRNIEIAADQTIKVEQFFDKNYNNPI